MSSELRDLLNNPMMKALERNILETEAAGLINGTHLMDGLGALNGLCQIYSLGQIYHMNIEDLRVEIGGLTRLFSDALLTGRVDDYETFRKAALDVTMNWKPRLMEEARLLILKTAKRMEL